MSIFRSQQQVALNEILVACQQSADHYHDMADYLDEPEVTDELNRIGDLRQEITTRIEDEIRASGELPSAPNADKESFTQLFHRMRAAISPDEATEVIEVSQEEEQKLARLAESLRKQDLGESYDALMYELATNIKAVSERLEKLLAKLQQRQ